MKTIKIRYRGKLIGNSWQYNTPRVVELPIPFVSKSEKTGEVVCDPVGEFPEDDGLRLLAMSGPDGPYVEEKEPAIDTDKFVIAMGEEMSKEFKKPIAAPPKRRGNPNWRKGIKRSPSPRQARPESPSLNADPRQGVADEQVGV